jgi:hypothetical protein
MKFNKTGYKASSKDFTVFDKAGSSAKNVRR